MSKTDNTRPLLIQWGDTTKQGELQHYHRGEPCDFDRGNNEFNYKFSHRESYPRPVDAEEQPKNCIRATHAYGGKWYLGESKKGELKARRRKIRQRSRHTLREITRSTDREDWDILPIRGEGHHTVYWDLT